MAEASRSLGAGWGTVMLRIVLPNLRTAVLSASFLSVALVLALASLVLMHGFVYASAFRGAPRVAHGTPGWSLFLRNTVVGYAILDHFVLSSDHARITNIVRFGMHVPAVIIMLLAPTRASASSGSPTVNM
mgnify:CR=1 FL=1